MSNDTQTLTLTDFLLARISADEAMAQAAAVDQRLTWATTANEAGAAAGTDAGLFILFNPPARVLAECAAKRRIVRELRDRETCKRDPLDVAIYHLAAVYADHPDYREEWRP